MSTHPNHETDWNYRKTDQRLITVKTKNEKVRKAAVIDILTNLPFAIEISQSINMDNLQSGKEYLARFKVYTSKNIKDIDPEFLNFFDVVDVDQAIEDFIKAYWIYPSKIRFELVEFEEP